MVLVSTYVDYLADNAGGENRQSSGHDGGLVEVHIAFSYVSFQGGREEIARNFEI